MPVFILYVAVIYGAAYVIHRPEWRNVLYTLAFLRTYLPTTCNLWQANIPIAPLWSLNVEEHCYLFLSLVTLIAPLRGREGPFLLLAGTISIAIHFAYAAFPSIAPAGFAAVRTEAAAGHLLISAGYLLMRKRYVPPVRPWMPLAATAAAAACYAGFAPWWSSIVLSPFLLAFAVNHLSETPRWFRGALACALETVGDLVVLDLSLAYAVLLAKLLWPWRTRGFLRGGNCGRRALFLPIREPHQDMAEPGMVNTQRARLRNICPRSAPVSYGSRFAMADHFEFDDESVRESYDHVCVCNADQEAVQFPRRWQRIFSEKPIEVRRVHPLAGDGSAEESNLSPRR